MTRPKPAEPRISVRISPDLRARLDKVLELGLVEETDLVRRCVEAACDYIESNGQWTTPLLVTPTDCLGQISKTDPPPDESSGSTVSKPKPPKGPIDYRKPIQPELNEPPKEDPSEAGEGSSNQPRAGPKKRRAV